MNRFRAFVSQTTDGTTTASVQELDVAFLYEAPGKLGQREMAAAFEGPQVLVSVEWSGINYKDRLALDPSSKVARRSPLIPGIDLAGIVVAAPANSGFEVGDEVLATGYELGVSWHGGFAELARVPSAWLVKRPANLSSHDAMIFGTAGFTAWLCVAALERNGIAPGDGDVLVTGATGGVGSIAVALLSQRGYAVTAATGDETAQSWLRELGASSIISRDELLTKPTSALGQERWAGAVDVVGGETIARVLETVKLGGAVASCGQVSGLELRVGLQPFILRGVSLLGVGSAYTNAALRPAVWQGLAQLVGEKREILTGREISLSQLEGALRSTTHVSREEMKRGRALVNCQSE